MEIFGLNDDLLNHVSRMQKRTMWFVVFWSIINVILVCAGLGFATAVVVGVLKLFGVL